MSLFLAATQTSLATVSAPNFGWRPFLTAMPVWDYWFWLILPLALGVAVAYKSTKCADPQTIPRESLQLTVWIVGGLIAAAAAVAIVARVA